MRRPEQAARRRRRAPGAPGAPGASGASGAPGAPGVLGASRGPAARARRGFTLIELMMVVILLGLIVSTVAVSYESLVPGAVLNAEVRKLSATLARTRSEAISRKAEFFIRYDLDANSYQVLTPWRVGGGLMAPGDFEEDRLAFDPHVLDRSLDLATVYVGEDQRSAGKVLVRFDPLGAASDHAVVLSQPEYENFYTVEVLALTGMIRFHPDVYVREPAVDGDFR